MSEQKALLVTGASTGIGRAAVGVAVKHGALVYASVRSGTDGDGLKASFGDRVQPLLFDMTDEAAVAATALDVARRQNGKRLLGVVNNAGASVPGPLLYMTAAELRQQMEVNLIGVHNVTRAFAPLLGAEGAPTLAEGPPGRFVMISSVGGKRALPFIAAYAASKFALEGYSEGLRRELMPFGIDVIVIGPGAVKTAIWDKGLSFDRSRYAQSTYARIIETFLAAVGQQASRGLEADAVGKLIWRTLTSPNPKVRYAIMRDWLMGGVVPQLLSPRALDRVVARRFGLGKTG